MPGRTAAHDHARALALQLGSAWRAQESAARYAVLEGPDGDLLVEMPDAATVRVTLCAAPAGLVPAAPGEFTGTVSGSPADLPGLAAAVAAELAPVMARRAQVLAERTERAAADLEPVTARALQLLGPNARSGPGAHAGHVRIGWPGGWVELHADGSGRVRATNLRADSLHDGGVRELLALLLAADAPAAAIA